MSKIDRTELETNFTNYGSDNLTNLHSKFSIISYLYASVDMDMNSALNEALKTNQYVTNLEMRVLGIENM